MIYNFYAVNKARVCLPFVVEAKSEKAAYDKFEAKYPDLVVDQVIKQGTWGYTPENNAIVIR